MDLLSLPFICWWEKTWWSVGSISGIWLWIMFLRSYWSPSLINWFDVGIRQKSSAGRQFGRTPALEGTKDNRCCSIWQNLGVPMSRWIRLYWLELVFRLFQSVTYARPAVRINCIYFSSVKYPGNFGRRYLFDLALTIDGLVTGFNWWCDRKFKNKVLLECWKNCFGIAVWFIWHLYDSYKHDHQDRLLIPSRWLGNFCWENIHAEVQWCW